MTEHESNARQAIIEVYANESTETLKEKLRYYQSIYRVGDWTTHSWICGLSQAIDAREND